MPKILTVDQFIQEVDDGEFFYVEFIKKTNGEFRKMKARRKVAKGVKNDPGTNGSWNRANQDKEHGVLTCWDTEKLQDEVDLDNPKNRGAHRRINLDGLLRATAHGVYYEFNKDRNVFIETGRKEKKNAKK